MMRKFILTAGMTMAAAAICGAQAPELFETMAPQRGIVPFGTYAVDKIGAINATSGALSLKIPVAQFAPGRGGFAAGLDLVYNSEIYDISYGPELYYTGIYPHMKISNWGGWEYSYGYDLDLTWIIGSDGQGSNTCEGPDNVYYKLSLITPDRSSHTLLQAPLYYNDNVAGDGYYQAEPTGRVGGPCDPGAPISENYAIYYTSDGSYLRLVFHSNPAYGPYWFDQHWTLYYPDGRTVYGIGAHATRVEDANGNGYDITQTLGNCLDQNDTCAPNADLIAEITLTDDLGRQITLEQTVNGSGVTTSDAITQPGPAGSTLTTTARFVALNVTGDYSTGDGPILALPANTAIEMAISEIDLPAVNSFTPTYTFGYADADTVVRWGELHSITLPSGGTIQYTYALDGGGIPPVNQLTENPVVTKVVAQTSPYSTADTSRYCYKQGYVEYPFSGCGFTPPSICTLDCMVMQDPAGGFTRYDYYDTSAGALNRGIVYKTTHPDGSTDETQWWNNRPYQDGNDMANPYPKAQIHSVASGGSPTKAAITLSTLDKNGNELESQDFDWTTYSSITHGSGGDVTAPNPSGSPLRTKISTFVTTTATQAGQGLYTTSVPDDSSGYWHGGGPVHWNLLHNSYTTSTVGLGSAVSFGYDATSTGNPTSEWHWDSTKGSLTSFLSSPTTSNGLLTQRTFSQGNLMTLTDPKSNVTAYGYDDFNLCVTSVTQGSGVRHFAMTRDINTGNPDLPGNCMLTSLTDGDNSATMSYTYDAVGRLLSSTDSTTQKTQYAYDDTNRKLTVTSDRDALNDALLVNTSTFDQLGRIYQTQQKESVSSSITQEHDYAYSGSSRYELVSNPYELTTDPTMGWMLTEFDQMNRPVCAQAFAGATAPSYSTCPTGTTGAVRHSYDGSTMTELDQSGVSKATDVDALGRLTSVTENGISLTTSYGYDVNDNLITVEPAGAPVGSCSGAQRSFTYDSMNRLASACNPESGTIAYTYDNNGNLATKTDARSVVTTMNYDALDRILSKNYSDSTPAVAYGYDSGSVAHSKGRLTSVTTSAVTRTITGYDAAGRVTGVTQTVGAGTPYTISHQWNADGALAQTALPTGRTINYAYDGAGRVASVTGTLGGVNTAYASGVTYAPQGAIAQMTMGNGITESASFNPRLQTASIQATLSGSNLLKLTYGYDTTSNSNGNVLSQQIDRYSPALGGNPAWSQTWNQTYHYSENPSNYDDPTQSVNRLSVAAEAVVTGGTAWTQNFGYDPAGNRWVSSYPGLPAPTNETPTASGWYGTNNRIVQSGWTYDNAGNITAVGGMSRSFQYDAENRQKQATVNGITETYTYDGEGRRVAKTGPSGTTIYVYDGTGELAVEYPATAPTTGGTEYLTADALGSTRLITDAGGNCVQDEDYLPFGEQIPSGVNGRTAGCFGATDVVPEKKFTGKERDTESGLDYFGARYYGSSMGRFMSPDHPLIDQHPEDPQSWNLYAYVRNNPLINLDPTGLGCVTDMGQGSDKDHESVELNNSISSDDCAGQHGTWVPGDVSKDNIGAFRSSDGSIDFQATTNTGGNVYYSSFVSGAQTDANGVGPGASIAHASTDWLSSQIVGGSLDQMMSFAANRMEPRSGGGLMALLAGPGFSPDAPDNWAGPGGMGTPQGQGDWAAMVHDYNFFTNNITIGTYFNPFVSRATAKALIQSDNNLVGHAGGAQSVKMGMLFGVVNAFQWLTHPF